MRLPASSPSRVLGLILLLAWLPACGGSSSGGPRPTPPAVSLGPTPIPQTPVATQATSDTPTFTVRNAQGYDLGQATYTFFLLTHSGARTIAQATVPAGQTTTSVTFAGVLPRGMTLTWNVVAQSPLGSVPSTTATFQTAAVACVSGVDPYGKSVVDWFVPACSLAQNIYNDPLATLGPPDAGGTGPDHYSGFMSLGDDGYVTDDMEACAIDLPGPDVRVYQTVSGEPVTLWAGGTPTGPWQQLGYRVDCGNVERKVFSHYCDFDLADAEVDEARYFKIEDGENYPCPGDTVTEGADIDAIKILHQKP
jgi:hypothetical protein